MKNQIFIFTLSFIIICAAIISSGCGGAGSASSPGGASGTTNTGGSTTNTDGSSSIDTLKPSPPTNLNATAGENSVSLTWNAPKTNSDSSAITDLSGYNVYMQTSPFSAPSKNGEMPKGILLANISISDNNNAKFVIKKANGKDKTFTKIGAMRQITEYHGGEKKTYLKSFAPQVIGTSYTANSLENGTKYYFIVKAVDKNNNESEPSDSIFSTPIDKTAPQITSVNAQKAIVNEQMCSLEFKVTGASHYMLSSSADFSGASWKTFTSVVNQALTAVDGQKTFYAKFKDEAGNETETKTVSVYLNKESPSAVSNFQVSTTEGDVTETTITLQWSKSYDSDIDKYEIYRTTDATLSASLLAPNTPSTSEYLSFKSHDKVTKIDEIQHEQIFRNPASLKDVNCTQNTKYYYMIYIVDEGGNYNWATAGLIDGTTKNATPTKVNLTTSKVDVTSIILKWDKSTDTSDFFAYKIFKSKTSEVSYSTPNPVIISNIDTVSYEFTGLEEVTNYWFCIYVYDKIKNNSDAWVEGSNSEKSNIINEKTKSSTITSGTLVGGADGVTTWEGSFN